MVTRPPELHAFASWEGFLAATAAAEASPAAAAATAATEEAQEADAERKEQTTRPTEDAGAFAHYLLPPLRLVAHPHTEATLPQLLVSFEFFALMLLLLLLLLHARVQWLLG